MTAAGTQERGNIYSSVPLGRELNDPARDFVPVMVFLAGERARFITGRITAVNGGARHGPVGARRTATPGVGPHPGRRLLRSPMPMHGIHGVVRKIRAAAE